MALRRFYILWHQTHEWVKQGGGSIPCRVVMQYRDSMDGNHVVVQLSNGQLRLARMEDLKPTDT